MRSDRLLESYSISFHCIKPIWNGALGIKAGFDAAPVWNFRSGANQLTMLCYIYNNFLAP